MVNKKPYIFLDHFFPKTENGESLIKKCLD